MTAEQSVCLIGRGEAQREGPWANTATHTPTLAKPSRHASLVDRHNQPCLAGDSREQPREAPVGWFALRYSHDYFRNLTLTDICTQVSQRKKNGAEEIIKKSLR